MINYIKGDVLGALVSNELDVVAHGCNCVGGFGSGIAGQIAQIYPGVRTEYLYWYNSGQLKLGNTQIVKVKPDKYIVNCATQFDYTPRTVQHADYNAIKKALTEVKIFCKKYNYKLGIPCIGAGLARGLWSEIEPIIEGVFEDYSVTVYYLNSEVIAR